ncbi:demethylmenaquinone methyltransferase-like [Mytilus trossulus]|uniref:demethylmenaquinone methyltransferase-like n=1 Tax=Mytilus trossulus TaxID=6551 RepID=UPI003006B215
MSQFADYESASENYDHGRRAAGADVIVGMMQVHLKKDIKDIDVLDAGCGTGNYSAAILKHGVRKLSMMDASKGMLTKANEKLVAMGLSSYVDVKQALLPNLPYADNTFDVVMMNQVLHHIEKNPDGENYPSIIDTFEEVNRVLKSSGLLVITTMVKEQLPGVWYYCFNKEFLRRYSLKFPSVKAFKTMLLKSNFDVVNSLSVLGHDIVPNYTNLEGPLNKSDRDSESYWDVASKQELLETLNTVHCMKEMGTLQRFYEEHDKTDEQGYFAIIIARKQDISQIEKL